MAVFQSVLIRGVPLYRLIICYTPCALPSTFSLSLAREVLIVRRTDQLLSFRLDCPVPGHLLRVVDNDEEEEIPRIAHVTQPQLYGPNRVSENTDLILAV